MTVSVSLHTSPIKTIEVDLSSGSWKSLNYENFGPFRIEEQKRVCSAYPNGLFPLAKSNSDSHQLMLIIKFSNYIEFTKILEDEVITIDGKKYLTTLYYERRGSGWSDVHTREKIGTPVGYCVNGFTYHPDDIDAVNKLIYGIVYYSLVAGVPEFQSLLKYLNENCALSLKGAPLPFLTELKKLLLDRASKK